MKIIIGLLMVFAAVTFIGCVTADMVRHKYYRASVKPFKDLKDLKRGDSLTVAFGDSIPFRYGKNKIGFERGRVLIVRNAYNKLEFFEVGEWTDHDGENITGKWSFDDKIGCIKDCQWNYFDGSTPAILCDETGT
jgi:hypothetical protein